MGKVRSFDPKKMSLIVGSIVVSGFATGTFIETGYLEPERWKEYSGADGEPARVKNNNKLGFFRFSLMNTSPANQALSLLFVADDLTGEGRVPVLVKDDSGFDVSESPEAWIYKKPSLKKGTEVEPAEWELHGRDYEDNLGGN